MFGGKMAVPAQHFDVGTVRSGSDPLIEGSSVVGRAACPVLFPVAVGVVEGHKSPLRLVAAGAFSTHGLDGLFLPSLRVIHLLGGDLVRVVSDPLHLILVRAFLALSKLVSTDRGDAGLLAGVSIDSARKVGFGLDFTACFTWSHATIVSDIKDDSQYG